MTIGWAVLALSMMNPPRPTEDVTVYFASRGTSLVAGATRVAAAALRQAGVTIAWRDPGADTTQVPRTWLRIELVEGPADDRLPGVLAISYPRAGCSKGITVFVDRIRSLADGVTRESALLGYVLAHEITHVIQGLNHHSPSGVMKARWTEADRAAIFQRRLGFEDVDVQLIRRGLGAGWCGVARTLRGPSEPGTAFHPE